LFGWSALFICLGRRSAFPHELVGCGGRQGLRPRVASFGRRGYLDQAGFQRGEMGERGLVQQDADLFVDSG
jgi:hypothetical protein